MDKKEDELTYFSEDFGDFQIISKINGVIGHIIYKNEIKLWVFYPKNIYYYKPVILALILTKLNYLNGYKKEEKNE